MQQTSTSAPSWSTAAFGNDTVTSPMELRALGSHLQTCASGRFFAMRCVADLMHGFVAPRLVTTLVVAALLIAGAMFLI